MFTTTQIQDEYAYQAELITTAIQDCIPNDIGGKLLADPQKLLIEVLQIRHENYSRSISKWYENIDIAVHVWRRYRIWIR